MGFRSDFFRLNPWLNDQQSSTKHLLFFANIQNSVGTDILNLLLNCEAISDTCQQLFYTKENDPSKSEHFSRKNHVCVCRSNRIDDKLLLSICFPCICDDEQTYMVNGT